MGCGAAAHARSLAREQLRGLRRRLPDRVPVPGTTGGPAVGAGRTATDQQAGPELPARRARTDPDDLRSKRIALTPRGIAAVSVIREAVSEVETAWAEQLGAARFDELRNLLLELNGLT